jgi:cell wall-associated NlpC family hydrolase
MSPNLLLLGGSGRTLLCLIAALAVAVLLALAFGMASAVAVWSALTGATFADRPDGLPPAARTSEMPPGAPVDGVVGVASRYIGMPYVWGGASPQTSFDCSGLTQWSYRQVGVRLPRTAQEQHDATAPVASHDLRPGDLVFFRNTYPSREPITHVGLYVGDGMMINAPSEGKSISVQPAFTGFWGAHFAGGGRPRS